METWRAIHTADELLGLPEGVLVRMTYRFRSGTTVETARLMWRDGSREAGRVFFGFLPDPARRDSVRCLLGFENFYERPGPFDLQKLEVLVGGSHEHGSRGTA
jgi:hypothetical protein